MNICIKLKYVLLIIFLVSVFDIGETPSKELGYKIGYYIKTGEWIEVAYIDFYLIKN